MKKEKTRKPVSITRRIQLQINQETPEQRKPFLETLYSWQRITQWSANFVMSHQYMMDNLKELIYLEEEVKVKLAKKYRENSEDGSLEIVNPDGILATSRPNATYQLLSKKFKGQIPTAILTALNSQLTSVYSQEYKQYYTGQRSLRNYRNTIPIPFGAEYITNIHKADQYDNYAFTLFGLPFKTFFGIDRSGNKIIFERALNGEYKLCQSSIQLKDRKIWLLAVFAFEKQNLSLDTATVGEASLSFEHPMTLQVGRSIIHIGDKEEYLHRRLSIQAQLRKHQRQAKWNHAQNGRTRRLEILERYRQWETNYISTKMHKYSNELIKHCIQHGVGKLVLKNQTQKEEEAKEQPFVLRNWSYYGLVEKIKYKAAKVGIELEVE